MIARNAVFSLEHNAPGCNGGVSHPVLTGLALCPLVSCHHRATPAQCAAETQSTLTSLLCNWLQPCSSYKLICVIGTKIRRENNESTHNVRVPAGLLLSPYRCTVENGKDGNCYNNVSHHVKLTQRSCQDTWSLYFSQWLYYITLQCQIYISNLKLKMICWNRYIFFGDRSRF